MESIPFLIFGVSFIKIISGTGIICCPIWGLFPVQRSMISGLGSFAACTKLINVNGNTFGLHFKINKKRKKFVRRHGLVKTVWQGFVNK